MPTTKPFLTFAIPTWNRQREVTVCVESIASQIKETIRHVTIIVQDDCSTDGTRQAIEDLQAKYPFIQYRCTEKRTDYSAAFRSLFTVADSEWVWTFGDDDMLMPGALDKMLKVLTDTDCEFIHVAETGREAGSGKMYKGTLLNLCNSFGWLDMTGFITGNVIKCDRLREVAASPRWDFYAKSAFVHSCAFLEVLRDSQCALLDVPLIATQNKTQTQESIDRWAADRIGDRYLLVADCVEKMFDEGILSKKVKMVFFRYTDYHLWNRHATYFIDDYLKHGRVHSHESWHPNIKMLRFIDDEEYAQYVSASIEGLHSLTILHAYLSANLDGLKKEMETLVAEHGKRVYPWSILLPPPKPSADPKQRFAGTQ